MVDTVRSKRSISKEINTRKGFTIVELLIVVVVIAILAAVTVVAYNGISRSAKESALKADLKSAATQLGVIKADTDAYPGSDGGLKRSNNVTFQYRGDTDTFCLTATMAGLDGVAFHIDESGSIKDGPCAGHSAGGAAEDAQLGQFSDGEFRGPVTIGQDGAYYMVAYGAVYRTTDLSQFSWSGGSVGQLIAGVHNVQGHADGQGSAARFSDVRNLITSPSGDLYVTDVYYDGIEYSYIRKITPSGQVTTIAGGEQGYVDGQGSAARFSDVQNLITSPSGDLYVTDVYYDGIWYSYIRKITPSGQVTTIAGGEQGHADGQGSAARFGFLDQLTVDGAGNFYASSEEGVRKITPTGFVTTLSGTPQGYNWWKLIYNPVTNRLEGFYGMDTLPQ